MEATYDTVEDGGVPDAKSITYILENPLAKTKRRYYVGKSKNLKRRLKEHLRDRYKNYRLIYFFCSKIQVEGELKRFGVTRFLELSEIDKFEILEAFVFIKTCTRSLDNIQLVQEQPAEFIKLKGKK